MLPRKFRLKKKIEFKNTYQKGKSLANAYLVLYFIENNNNIDRSKIAFAVGKKIGKAVVRNHIKRRMREACKNQLFRIKGKYNIIFIARAKIKGISNQDIEKQMLVLLKKAGLINQE